MISTNINYVDKYFEFPPLTRIRGEPMSKSLKAVKDELCTNTTSVITDLVGGAHDHLGLVLPAVDYTLVLVDPYTRPIHPGTLGNPP